MIEIDIKLYELRFHDKDERSNVAYITYTI